MGAQNKLEVNARRYKAGQMKPAERQEYEEKQKTKSQLESLQSELATLKDQFGKLNQPAGQPASTTYGSAYSVGSTLGKQSNLRIGTTETKASSIRRRNRAM